VGIAVMMKRTSTTTTTETSLPLSAERRGTPPSRPPPIPAQEGDIGEVSKLRFRCRGRGPSCATSCVYPISWLRAFRVRLRGCRESTVMLLSS
jgi:hypothetical protein